MWSWKLIKDLEDSSLRSALARQVVTFEHDAWEFPDCSKPSQCTLPPEKSSFHPSEMQLYFPCQDPCLSMASSLLHHWWDDTSSYLTSLKFGRPLPQQNELIRTVYLQQQPLLKGTQSPNRNDMSFVPMSNLL